MPVFTEAMHKALWLCQAQVTVDDLTTTGADSFACKVGLAVSGDRLTVTSTGIPSHDFQSGGGCCAKAQALTFHLPMKPQMASTITMAPTRGATGVAINGAELFGPEDADSRDVVRYTHTTTSGEPRLALCDAHSNPDGMFHYHADMNCIHWHSGGAAWSTYSWAKIDATKASPIVGFAFDGIPIYGSYASGNGTVREVTSSYRLKSGHDGMKGIADYEYVAGLGDLDECNGRVEATPEFPAGAYVYHSTLHNGAGDLGFPYFPHCYKGVVDTSNTQTMGGMGMGGGTTTTGGPGGSSGSGQPSGGPPSGTSTCPPPPQGSPPTGPPPAGCGPPPH
jgi:hypothetical protein